MSQDAAFGSVIPSGQGLAIPLTGGIQDIGGQHWAFHQSMERFWEPYRRGGSLFGQTPTVGQYNAAMTTSLQAAGIPPAIATSLTDQAAAQQRAFGLGANSQVPQIPGRTNVAQPPAAKAKKPDCKY